MAIPPRPKRTISFGTMIPLPKKPIKYSGPKEPPKAWWVPRGDADAEKADAEKEPTIPPNPLDPAYWPLPLYGGSSSPSPSPSPSPMPGVESNYADLVRAMADTATSQTQFAARMAESHEQGILYGRQLERMEFAKRVGVEGNWELSENGCGSFIKGKNCVIHLEPVPASSDSLGRWAAVSAGWQEPRYYFDSIRAMAELESWLKARGEFIPREE